MLQIVTSEHLKTKIMKNLKLLQKEENEYRNISCGYLYHRERKVISQFLK
jgi:hypothetical protein